MMHRRLPEMRLRHARTMPWLHMVTPSSFLEGGSSLLLTVAVIRPIDHVYLARLALDAACQQQMETCPCIML